MTVQSTEALIAKARKVSVGPSRSADRHLILDDVTDALEAAMEEIERLRGVHDRIGDYVIRHYLDTRMGREVLNIIAEHGGRAVTDPKEDV